MAHAFGVNRMRERERNTHAHKVIQINDHHALLFNCTADSLHPISELDVFEANGDQIHIFSFYISFFLSPGTEKKQQKFVRLNDTR